MIVEEEAPLEEEQYAPSVDIVEDGVPHESKMLLLLRHHHPARTHTRAIQRTNWLLLVMETTSLGTYGTVG